jgi:hypothetical protein
VPTLGGDFSGRIIQTPATCTINTDSDDVVARDAAQKAIARSKCGSYNEVDLRSKEPCLSNTFIEAQTNAIVPACVYTPGTRNPQLGSYSPDLFAANQFSSENQSLIGRTKARILPCTTCDKLVDDKCMIINNGYHVAHQFRSIGGRKKSGHRAAEFRHVYPNDCSGSLFELSDH